ncbi:MAG: hypothetical protein HFH73_04365 [Lachnospiraceae bacterium]|nr:hypothetical protein [Lachnospiraceae bacterium]
MDSKMTKKIIGAFTAIILVAAVVLAVYFAMNKQAQKEAEENVLPTTEVGKILAKDLELKYPETPTEVLKLYWRINKCMYNDGVSDGDFEKLLKQLRLLYDDELLAEKENSFEAMLKNFKKDRESYQDSSRKISSAYNVQENKTISVKKLDGKDYATVITSILLKAKGEKNTKTYEKFMCRRDANGKWKILGWQQTNADEAAKAGVK